MCCTLKPSHLFSLLALGPMYPLGTLSKWNAENYFDTERQVEEICRSMVGWHYPRYYSVEPLFCVLSQIVTIPGINLWNFTQRLTRWFTTQGITQENHYCRYYPILLLPQVLPQDNYYPRYYPILLLSQVLPQENYYPRYYPRESLPQGIRYYVVESLSHVSPYSLWSHCILLLLMSQSLPQIIR